MGSASIIMLGHDDGNGIKYMFSSTIIAYKVGGYTSGASPASPPLPPSF